MSETDQVRQGDKKLYNFSDLVEDDGKLLCPECGTPAGSRKGIVGLYGHLWKMHGIRANIVGAPHVKRAYKRRKKEETTSEAIAGSVVVEASLEELLARLDDRFQAVLHPAIHQHSSKPFMEGVTLAYAMFRQTFSKYLPPEEPKLVGLDALAGPVTSRLDQMPAPAPHQSVCYPRNRRHTCGIDGDAGPVTPLDGRCVACEQGGA